ncbi:unnamed protein product, partial [Heterotrigona itama]
MKYATSTWKVQFTSRLAEMSASSGRIHCWSERRGGGGGGLQKEWEETELQGSRIG